MNSDFKSIDKYFELFEIRRPNMERGTYFIKTFGCQMNVHDSQKIGGLLASLGYAPAAAMEDADLILFNTCTVRAKAHQKAFSEIGKAAVLKRSRQSSVISRELLTTDDSRLPLVGICGCVAQEEGSRLLERFPEIDLVFGPDQIHRLPKLLDLIAETGKPAIATELINNAGDYHFLDTSSALRLFGPSAYVTIMKGCNSQCSYCIVPAVRGKEVYRPARDIFKEIDQLVQNGAKEVTLLGQNVNSYGRGAEDGIGFAKLLRLIAENSDVQRLRFTSPHPKDCREDLIEEFASNPKLCPHIHLPLQSGCDEVLHRMRRAYNIKTYREKIEKLRRARTDIAITTDMIVGFPQETDEEFNQTIDFIDEIRFDGMFAFQYSPRPGTEAYTFRDDVPREIKEERLQRLLKVQNEISSELNRRYLGSIQEVLVEGRDKMGLKNWSGRTLANKIVNFTGKDGLFGCIVKVEVTKACPNSLEGEFRGDDHG